MMGELKAPFFVERTDKRLRLPGQTAIAGKTIYNVCYFIACLIDIYLYINELIK